MNDNLKLCKLRNDVEVTTLRNAIHILDSCEDIAEARKFLVLLHDSYSLVSYPNLLRKDESTDHQL